jgi:amino acid transporter
MEEIPHSQREETTNEGLIRAIGTRGLALNIVNLVVGAGIFVLPGVVAVILGPAAVLAYFVCAVAVALVFLCFAEAGSRVSRSGGAYAYIEDAFGPFVGFISSILLWFGWGVLAQAAIGVALVETIAIAFPAMGSGVPRTLFFIVLYGTVGAINIVGVRSGARLAAFNTYAKLIPLAVLVFLGMSAVEMDNILIQDWPSLSEIGAGALILIFAFGGAEIALNAGGEIREPSKTVPRGLMLGLGFVFILYMAIHGVAQGVLGPDLAANTEAPLVATAERAIGDWGRKLLLIGMAVSMFGVITADLLSSPRVIFAAARDGLLPSFLGRVHPRFKTPFAAILVYITLACGFALSGTFKTLAVVGSGSLLILYLGTSLAVLQLRRSKSSTGIGVFRIPGGPVVPILSMFVVLWLLSSMTRQEAIGLIVLIFVAAILYVMMRLLKKRQTDTQQPEPAED